LNNIVIALNKDTASNFQYLKFSQVLVGLLAFFYILYIGHDILVPLVLAALIAILLNPLVNILHRRMHRVLAIAIVLFFAAIVFAGIIYFVTTQMMNFGEALPQFKEKFGTLWNNLIGWVSDTFNLSRKNIDSLMQRLQAESMEKLGS